MKEAVKLCHKAAGCGGEAAGRPAVRLHFRGMFELEGTVKFQHTLPQRLRTVQILPVGHIAQSSRVSWCCYIMLTPVPSGPASMPTVEYPPFVLLVVTQCFVLCFHLMD